MRFLARSFSKKLPPCLQEVHLRNCNNPPRWRRGNDFCITWGERGHKEAFISVMKSTQGPWEDLRARLNLRILSQWERLNLQRPTAGRIMQPSQSKISHFKVVLNSQQSNSIQFHDDWLSWVSCDVWWMTCPQSLDVSVYVYVSSVYLPFSDSQHSQSESKKNLWFIM